jgi:hypothetical protein
MCVACPVFFVFVRPHAILAALMRTRFDQVAKQMVRAALATRGHVETDAEVVPATPAKQTSGDQEFLMSTHDIVETCRPDVIQESSSRPSCVESPLAERHLRSPPQRDAGNVRAVIDDAHDETTLRAWLKVGATRATDEIAAVIHASRAS